MLSAARRDVPGDQPGEGKAPGTAEAAAVGRGWWWRVVEGGEAAQVTTRSSPGSPPCLSGLEESAGGSSTQDRATGSLCHPKRAYLTSPVLHGERGRGRPVSGALSGQYMKDGCFWGVGPPQGFRFNAFEERP